MTMSRKDARKSLINFTNDVGILEHLIMDRATEFMGQHTEYVKDQMHIMLRTTKQGHKNQNHVAESEIGLLVRHWKLHMAKKKVPKCLWDFGLMYESELLC